MTTHRRGSKISFTASIWIRIFSYIRRTVILYGNSLGLGFAGTVEAQVAKSAGEVMSFRAALWFGAGLGVIALVLELAFVRMPKDNQEGWKSSGSSVERGIDTVGSTGV